MRPRQFLALGAILVMAAYPAAGGFYIAHGDAGVVEGQQIYAGTAPGGIGVIAEISGAFDLSGSAAPQAVLIGSNGAWGCMQFIDGVIQTNGQGVQFGTAGGTGLATQVGGTLAVSGGSFGIGIATGNGTYAIQGGLVSLGGVSAFVGGGGGGGGRSIGALNVTGGSFAASDSLDIGFDGGQGTANLTGGVFVAAQVGVGANGTVGMSNATLAVGKDCGFSADSLALYATADQATGNDVKLSVQLASLTDYTNLSVSGMFSSGTVYAADPLAAWELPILNVQLTDGFAPALGDEFVIAQAGSFQTTDPLTGIVTAGVLDFSAITCSTSLADPDWAWGVRVDEGTDLVLYVMAMEQMRIPEPATLALLALGGAALPRRRR